MSDSSPFGFGRFVPGFDFLQKLTEGAAAGMPAMPPMANWVAPTMSVEEIDQRIRELKTVQFWLEQNARALAATIQALEVQRMTLATLQGMNVAMKDLAGGAFKAAGAAAPAAAPKARASAPAPAAEAPAPAQEAAKPQEAAAAPTVDPLQWWGALTQQFQQIAAKAMTDVDAQQAALQATREMTTGALKAAEEMASSLVPKAPAAAAKKPQSPQGKAAAKKTAAKKAPARKTKPAR